MTYVSAGLFILTPTQPVRFGRGDRTHDVVTRSRALCPPRITYEAEAYSEVPSVYYVLIDLVLLLKFVNNRAAEFRAIQTIIPVPFYFKDCQVVVVVLSGVNRCPFKKSDHFLICSALKSKHA